MTDIVRTAFADIVKVSPQGDGSVLVYGRVAGETIDNDDQILDKSWLDKALPEWGERGNVRAMHQLISAGKMQSLTDDGKDWNLVSKIVDPTEAMKCREGIYTGYSVGIKNPVVKSDRVAKNGRIQGGKIIEVSLADNPCDPVNKLALIDKVSALPSEQEAIAGAQESEDTTKAAAADALIKALKPSKQEPAPPNNDDPDDEDADDTAKGPKKPKGSSKKKVSDIDQGIRDALRYFIVQKAEQKDAHDITKLNELAAKLTASSDEPTEMTFKLADAAVELIKADLPMAMPRGTRAAVMALGSIIESVSGPSMQIGESNADPVTQARIDQIRTRSVFATPLRSGAQEGADHTGPFSTPNTPKVSTASDEVVDLVIDRLVNKAAILEPATPTDPLSSILAKLASVEKAVQPDLLKAALSEVTKPLEDRIAEMEQRAAPGGPMLGGSKMLSAPDSAKAAIARTRLQAYVDLAESDDPRVASDAAAALELFGYNNK